MAQGQSSFFATYITANMDCNDNECQSDAHLFGSKSIGMFAGIALLINNVTGPGVPQLANMFVEAGWLFPVVCILLTWMITTFSASMYCEAMRNVPGNEYFRDRIEYSTIVKHYFGRSWYIAAQVGLNGALQSLNIISVVQSAQVMDNALSAMFGSSCALNFTPYQNIWTDGNGKDHPVAMSDSFLSCFDTMSLDAGNAWGCHVVLTAGFVLTAAMAIPCGRWNLDDNMTIQTTAFILTILCWVMWIVASLTQLDANSFSSLPAVNTDGQTGSQAAVLGTILFNFGFVTTVPSWVNEKKYHVSANKTLWVSTLVCVAVFFSVGLSGALAFPKILQGQVTGTCDQQAYNDASFNCANDMLQVFTNPATNPWASSSIGTFILKLSVYAFPIVAVVSSIPVFSIVIKYNLMENGFSKRAGFLWGVVFPWAAAFPLLYMPNALAQFVNLSSLVFVSFTDFVVPCVIYGSLLRKRRQLPETPLARAPSIESLPPGVREHFAYPQFCMPSRRVRIVVAYSIALVLLVGSGIAFVLTIQQGAYSLDHQTCALVGS